jgi:hypothetical protein
MSYHIEEKRAALYTAIITSFGVQYVMINKFSAIFCHMFLFYTGRFRQTRTCYYY